MIRMMRSDRGIDPRIVCDYCGEIIQDGHDGTILWEVNAQRIIVTGHPVMLHTACRRPFAREHAGRQQWQCEPLDVFTERLTTALHREHQLTYSATPHG